MPYRSAEILTCPHCDEAVLSTQTVQWIARRACAGCGGVWFDRDALDELARDVGLESSLPFGEPWAISAK